MAGPDVDPADGLALRLYESSGRPTEASIRCRWPIVTARVTNVLEEDASAAATSGTSRRVQLEPYEIVTVAGDAQGAGRGRRAGPPTSRRAASRAARLRGLLAAQQGRGADGLPGRHGADQASVVPASGPFTLPIVVASERTDGAAAGSVSLIVPPGWEATPPDRIYRLAPGAHLAFEATVRPAAGARSRSLLRRGPDRGRGGPAPRGRRDDRSAPGRRRPGARPSARRPLGGPRLGGRTSPGDRRRRTGTRRRRPTRARGTIRVASSSVTPSSRRDRGRAGRQWHARASRCRNLAASEIRGEAQVLSPLETWSTITPWTQGFAGRAGRGDDRDFDVAPPRDVAAGTYWALVKVMYFGRLLYSESVPFRILRVTTGGRRSPQPDGRGRR